jgi:acyl-CoA thioester hydrolase
MVGLVADETTSDEFVWPVRVYYEDTDAGGVVYYANYLKYMERARTEWLRHLGFEQDQLRKEHGTLFAVSQLELVYHHPSYFNELLEVSAKVSRRGKASLVFYQEVRRQQDHRVLCSGHIKIACLDHRAMRPTPIPKPVLQEIMHVA